MDMEEPGQRLLFENDRIRIWEETVHKGANPRQHRHAHQFLPIAIEGGAIEALDERGRTVWEGELEPGPMDWRGSDDVPFVHAVRNASDHDIRVVVVEDIGT